MKILVKCKSLMFKKSKAKYILAEKGGNFYYGKMENYSLSIAYFSP